MCQTMDGKSVVTRQEEDVVKINMYKGFTVREKELNSKGKSLLTLSVQSKLVSIERDLISSHHKNIG